MIKNIDNILDRLRKRANNYMERMNYGACDINFYVYGKVGVMKLFDTLKYPLNNKVGIVIEDVSETQEKSKAVCHEISGKFMHMDFPNQYNNAGNLAFLYSPSEIYVGEVYTFNVYHLAEIDDPCAPFPIKVSYIEN